MFLKKKTIRSIKLQARSEMKRTSRKSLNSSNSQCFPVLLLEKCSCTRRNLEFTGKTPILFDPLFPKAITIKLL